jgi:hypothetical protein
MFPNLLPVAIPVLPHCFLQPLVFLCGAWASRSFMPYRHFGGGGGRELARALDLTHLVSKDQNSSLAKD